MESDSFKFVCPLCHKEQILFESDFNDKKSGDTVEIHCGSCNVTAEVSVKRLKGHLMLIRNVKDEK